MNHRVGLKGGDGWDVSTVCGTKGEERSGWHRWNLNYRSLHWALPLTPQGGKLLFQSLLVKSCLFRGEAPKGQKPCLGDSWSRPAVRPPSRLSKAPLMMTVMKAVRAGMEQGVMSSLRGQPQHKTMAAQTGPFQGRGGRLPRHPPSLPPQTASGTRRTEREKCNVQMKGSAGRSSWARSEQAREGRPGVCLPGPGARPCRSDPHPPPPQALVSAPRPTLPGGGPSPAPAPGKAACFVPISTTHPPPPHLFFLHSLQFGPFPSRRDPGGRAEARGWHPPALTGRASPTLGSPFPRPPPGSPFPAPVSRARRSPALQHSIKIQKHLG